MTYFRQTYKPRIFVSSPIGGMENERKAVKKGIENARIGYPVLSEYTFAAKDKPSKEVCIEEVEKSDIYILLLGAKFGYEFEEGKSVTKLEYETAIKKKIPVFVFNFPVDKEPKQEEFANEVGNFFKGKFWNQPNDPFQLQEMVEETLKEFIEEERNKAEREKETIYGNLVPIRFPQKLFIANLDIDKEETLAKANQPIKKGKTRKIIFEALRQKGLGFGSDWHTTNNQIITFHDLYDSSIPLNSVIDQGSVECFSSEEYYHKSLDHENTFRALLGFCLQQKLYEVKIFWHPTERVFYFGPLDENKMIRKEKSGQQSKRLKPLFEPVKKKNNPDKLSHYKHFSFKTFFKLFNEVWLLGVLPGWYHSWDGGKKISFYNEDQKSFKKRQEKNETVYNHVNFIFNFLQRTDSPSVENQHPYKVLTIGNRIKIQAYPKIPK